MWEHFGFPVDYNKDGVRVEDRTRTVCRRCSTAVRYANGNTSQDHPDLPITGARQKTTAVQQLIPSVFKKPIDMKAEMFLAMLRPYAIVDSRTQMLWVIVQSLPGRSHISRKNNHQSQMSPRIMCVYGCDCFSQFCGSHTP